jgi:hypothetical protein
MADWRQPEVNRNFTTTGSSIRRPILSQNRLIREGEVMPDKAPQRCSVRKLQHLASWFWPSQPRKRIVNCIVAFVILAGASAVADVYLKNLFPFLDLTGFSATNSTTGSIDESGPFFQKLGTNGRTCETCHAPTDGFGLSAIDAQLRYALTRGKDPLFDQFDGSTCPTGPVNNSLVLKNGLLRIGIQVPPNSTDPDAAQYTIAAVVDPYGCALATGSNGVQTASMYRRPLPTSNLGFLSAIMWDGRESYVNQLNVIDTFPANLNLDLTQQAIDATLTHAQPRNLQPVLS